MLLCTKFRLQVGEADAQALEFMQGKCRGFYNWWVLRLRDGERWPGWAEAKATLAASKEHDPELRFVYGKLLHEVYFRLDKAMAAFFRRCQAAMGEKPGFPRVRPRHCFFTLCYPALYVKVEGDRLILPTGGGGSTDIPKRYPTIVARLDDPDCGLVLDRDVNSAINMLQRFLARLGPHTFPPSWLERAVCCARVQQSTRSNTL